MSNLARKRGVSKDAPARPGESTGWGARLGKQVQAAEARLRQAEQDTPPSQSSPPEFANRAECATQPPEYAKQQLSPASRGEADLPPAESAPTDERQAQLRTFVSDLLSRKGGLKVLRMAQLPKWRGHFKWQIEAKIEALLAEYARVRAETAKPDG